MAAQIQSFVDQPLENRGEVRTVFARGGKPVSLNGLAYDLPDYDGAAFATEYRTQRTAARSTQ